MVAETQRLILRRFTREDVGHLVELDSDPEVTFFDSGGVPEFDEAMLDAWLRQYERWPGYGTFAAVDRASGDFLGRFQLRPEDGREDEPELGYRFRRAAWGRGYATEGSRALIEKAFTAARRNEGVGGDHGGQPGFAPGDGEERHALRALFPRRLAVPHPG